jgi:CheY-like chemotaxis protein
MAALEIALAQIPGVEVAFVSSAAEALRSIKDEGKAISAVVTDIRMPIMDGFELIEVIRADREKSAIPIVVVTGDTDPDTPERTSRLGADAFFTKPFSPAAVRRTVEDLLYAGKK